MDRFTYELDLMMLAYYKKTLAEGEKVFNQICEGYLEQIKKYQKKVDDFKEWESGEGDAKAQGEREKAVSDKP